MFWQRSKHDGIICSFFAKFYVLFVPQYSFYIIIFKNFLLELSPLIKSSYMATWFNTTPIYYFRVTEQPDSTSSRTNLSSKSKTILLVIVNFYIHSKFSFLFRNIRAVCDSVFGTCFLTLSSYVTLGAAGK